VVDIEPSGWAIFNVEVCHRYTNKSSFHVCGGDPNWSLGTLTQLPYKLTHAQSPVYVVAVLTNRSTVTSQFKGLK